MTCLTGTNFNQAAGVEVLEDAGGNRAALIHKAADIPRTQYKVY